MTLEMSQVTLFWITLVGYTAIVQAHPGIIGPRLGRQSESYSKIYDAKAVPRANGAGPADGITEDTRDLMNLKNLSQASRVSSEQQVDSTEQLLSLENGGPSSEFRIFDSSMSTQQPPQKFKQEEFEGGRDSFDQISHEDNADSGLTFEQVHIQEGSSNQYDLTTIIPKEPNPGGPVTMEEIAQELELLSQDIKEAVKEKGEPLRRQDLEKLENKLEHEPWYHRLHSAVVQPISKFFVGIFGGRSKRYPNYLDVYYY